MQRISVEMDGGLSAVRPPDWSWQDVAARRCLDAVSDGSASKVGLVVPTGGGKTRIALRVALEWLSRAANSEQKVLWVTHREHLRDAALRALEDVAQEMASLEDPLSDGLRKTFASRVHFGLVQSIAPVLGSLGDDLGLVIVDEAHHAAAESYALIVGLPVPGLFLTATPNRSDGLPIGVDRIAFTTTYRELFQRNCVVEPTFHPPIDLADLDWTTPSGLRRLAETVLDGCTHTYAKVLVAVTQQERAETLHLALCEVLGERGEHPLVADDLAYVHGLRNSLDVPTTDFLERFSLKRRGVLVGTSQLIGEGFDDPFIDAVATTYPSTSISHLMQVAGRAMRSSPGKRAAHILQVHESPLEYHFEQRWLYQDISDRWRPSIFDWRFSDGHQRDARVIEILKKHNTAAAVINRITAQLSTLEETEGVQLMLTGVPYFGRLEDFEASSSWSAVLVTEQSKPAFVNLFNTLSDRNEDLKDEESFLKGAVAAHPELGVNLVPYTDLVGAIEYARYELEGDPAADDGHRPFHQRRGSTWLRYHVFAYEPVLPISLEQFLEGAVNRGSLAAAYVREPNRWAAALRIALPVEGWFCWLLDEAASTWFEAAVTEVSDRVRTGEIFDALSAVTTWRYALPSAPVPPLILERFDELTRRTDRERFHLPLR